MRVRAEIRVNLKIFAGSRNPHSTRFTRPQRVQAGNDTMRNPEEQGQADMIHSMATDRKEGTIDPTRGMITAQAEVT